MEGLPVVLMEAMAIGVPVVAPRVAGIPELVEHGRTGYVFTPAVWSELATCLGRVLQSARRQRGGRAARERVEQEFDIRGSAEALIAKLVSGEEPT